MEPITGQIMLTALAYAPKGWLFCDGATLSVNEYMELFSLINNTYGGNGYTTFCVPDLRGAIPMGVNYSSTPYAGIGDTGGSPTHMPIAMGAITNSGSIPLSYPAGNVPQSNLPPFVGLSYIICVNGLYPDRS